MTSTIPPASPATLSIADLQLAVRGRVIAPGDQTYDEARTVMTGGIDRRPAAIVRVADAGDVARVIGTARSTGLELAVRCGGHSGAGHGTTDGGIVLDLRDMRALDIDVDGRTAWAEAGLTAADYSAGSMCNGRTGPVHLVNEGPERVRAAYPGATWDRLRAIKSVHDPDNVFRLNQNIPPAEVPSQTEDS